MMVRQVSSDEESDHYRRSRRSDDYQRRSHRQRDRDGRREHSRSHRDRDDYDEDYRRRYRHEYRDRGIRRDRDRSPSMVSIELRPVHNVRSISPHSGKTKPQSSKTQKGPMKTNRSCTDVIFLILIILVMLLWLLVAFAAIKNVNLRNLLPSQTHGGELCGIDENVKDKPYLYVFNFTKCFGLNKDFMNNDPSCSDVTKVCVDKCPTETIDFREVSGKFSKTICTGTVRPTDYENLQQLIEDKQCAPYTLESRNIFGICIPKTSCSVLNGNAARTDDNMGCTDSPYIGIALDVVWDIADTHLTILGGFGVALVIGVLWMLLIRFLAGVVVWVSLMSFLMLFSALTVFTGVRAYEAYKQDPNSRVDASKLRNSPYVGSRWPIWAGMSGVLGLLFLFTLLILLFLRKRIQIAIALIKQASRSIANLPTLLVFPLFLYVLQVAALAFVAAFTFIIFALDNLDEQTAQKTCASDFKDLARINNSTIHDEFCRILIKFLQNSLALHVFNLFSGAWTILFVSAFGYFVVAHAVAKYFWTHKDDGTKCMAVGSSVGVTFRYHLGTLAFGSLILTICGLIKKSIKYVQRKPNSTTSNSCMQGILKSCACCFWLLEKLLKYVNKNAYIMVAMYGKNFCRSAGKAFKLIVNNAFRALVLTKVTDFFIFIAKLVTVATTSTLAYFALDSDSTREFLKIENRPKYIQAPVATIAIGSYILTSCFFNVYSNAVDTLFLCFLEDQKLNDGSRERPYQMPSELFKILNKGNYKRKYRTN